MRRTQIKRSSYHVVGKPENAEKPEPSKLTKGSLDMQVSHVFIFCDICFAEVCGCIRVDEFDTTPF